MPHDWTAIGEFPFVDRSTRETLSRHGITSLHDVRERSRSDLSKTTGLESATVARLADIAELLSVPGLQAPLVEMIVAAGITSVDELGQTDPGALADTLLAIQTERKSRLLLPSAAVVEGWVEHVRRDQEVRNSMRNERN